MVGRRNVLVVSKQESDATLPHSNVDSKTRAAADALLGLPCIRADLDDGSGAIFSGLIVYVKSSRSGWHNHLLAKLKKPPCARYMFYTRGHTTCNGDMDVESDQIEQFAPSASTMTIEKTTWRLCGRVVSVYRVQLQREVTHGRSGITMQCDRHE